MRRCCGLVLLILLSGCASLPPTPQIVVEKNKDIPPPSFTSAHLTSGNNPALLKAYQEYQKTGLAKTIETDQFVQFPYDAGVQPIIAASILELTVISLEPGEQVNSVSSGDPLRWSYSLVYSGTGQSRQAHILIKPAKANASTDFFITTDKRDYLLKMTTAVPGKYIREVRFWYPDKQTSIITTLPNMDLGQLNFNYQLAAAGVKPVWLPLRVFDDGTHTYIQLSADISAQDLPAVFIDNGESPEMVNYRFKTPYFIVDKIFSKAMLISGVGRHQQRVNIIRTETSRNRA
jgi:P-type conjugative transfer protein TrbG